MGSFRKTVIEKPSDPAILSPESVAAYVNSSNQESGIRGQESGVRSQESGVRNQGSEISAEY
jgi:hypothetical protein